MSSPANLHLFKSNSFFKAQFTLHLFPKAFQTTLAEIISPLTEFKEMFFSVPSLSREDKDDVSYKSFIVLPFMCSLKLARYVVGSRSTTFSFFCTYIKIFNTLFDCLPFPYCCCPLSALS